LAEYPSAQVYWVQEEPANMSFWDFVRVRLNIVLGKLGKSDTGLISRKVSATTAPGSPVTHKKEQEELLTRAFKG
jgi:2-oxoglutarate dehydrogenase complex dehydrogenase (E1) component-like enzyme